MCEVATTVADLRLGRNELAEAVEALSVACGQDSELARGAAELLKHNSSKLSS